MAIGESKLISKYKEIEDHNSKTGNDRKPGCSMTNFSNVLDRTPLVTADSNKEESDMDESESTEGGSLNQVLF